jgi:aryl-alcohol dehydrogenase-like predicted oxidoreductase
MEYATLGNTGLLVSKLCFGTMTFGDGRGIFKAISAVGQAGADELVKTSIHGGINFFDTADNYTEGESEKILGQSLKNLNIARQDVATKVYGRVGPGRNDIGASRGHIMDGVEASLRRLQTDHIERFRDPCRRDASRSRHPGAAGKGPLHRLLQLAGMEDRQSPRHRRVQEPGPI